MSLENLLRIGKLKAHVAARVEIDHLLAAADRGLVDAAIQGLSADSRLDLAYRAIMQGALAAMLASGHRPATNEPGHHRILIQSLPMTSGIAPERIRVLDAYRAARNLADYGGAPVSEAVARECVTEARSLLVAVRAWIATHWTDRA